MLDFLALQTTSENPDVIAIVYSLLTAFLLGVVIAQTYVKTFQGSPTHETSYNR